MMEPVLIGRPLAIADLVEVARHGRRVGVCPEARVKIDASRRAIDELAAAGDAGPSVYGVNTGFGALAETRIPKGQIIELQKNLVRSHSTGLGADLGAAEVRAMMLLRAQVVAMGHSGVRSEVVDLLVAMLNANVTPRVPEQGSVGASGDLAPLAHLALALIGEGEVLREGGGTEPSADALARAGLRPVELQAKEGLALINGTQLMTALGVLALADANALAKIADIAGAISLEALKGTKTPFDDRLMAVRPHPGQAATAKNLRALLAESPIMESHKDCGKVQDPYSLRCMPQVHGASRDALAFASGVLTREANSVTDNPTVFIGPNGTEILSGGNFHGQPVAIALDLAAIACAELANISERRVEQLVNPALSTGLTPFLAKESGLHSGFMIAQVASASVVSENKVLCHPASVDSIPSSAGREDHVSMGSVSSLKLVRVVKNVEAALAIEIMTACQGIDQRAPIEPSRGVRAAHRAIRAKVPTLDDDRPLYRDIATVRSLVSSGELARAVEDAIGLLE